jgi:hypothetical protein
MGIHFVRAASKCGVPVAVQGQGAKSHGARHLRELFEQNFILTIQIELNRHIRGLEVTCPRPVD